MAQDIIVPENMGALPAGYVMPEYDEGELAGGIVGSYAVIKIKGKEWAIKYRGEQNLLNHEDGSAVQSLEVVIVKAASTLSKVYYAGFKEGSTEAPLCWSSNNVNPDANVPEPQCAACAICPQNRVGSRTTDEGKAAKACADSKRVAVVPLGDMANEIYNGPMLLRIPAGSLGDLSTYDAKLRQSRYPFFLVGTRLSFARGVAYPKLVYQAIRVLNTEEAAYITELRNDHRISRILSEEVEGVEAQQAETARDGLFEQAPEAAPPAPAAPAAPPAPVATKAAPKPTPAPAPAPAPAATPPKAPAPATAPAPRPTATVTQLNPPAKAAPAGTIKAAVAAPAPVKAAVVATPAPPPAPVKAPTPPPVIEAVAEDPAAPSEAEEDEAPSEAMTALDAELANLLS